MWCGTFFLPFCLKKENRGKKVGGGFCGTAVIAKSKQALGLIYTGYLWSGRDEPMGFKGQTQRAERWRSDGSGVCLHSDTHTHEGLD